MVALIFRVSFTVSMRLNNMPQKKTFTVGHYVQMPADSYSVKDDFCSDVTLYCKLGPDVASSMELVWGSTKNDSTSYDLKLTCNISSNQQGLKKKNEWEMD